jgi:GNAT superfamily N-acetyltransferase
MNFEAFHHFQEKQRLFLEEEDAKAQPVIRSAEINDIPDLLLLLPFLWPNHVLDRERCTVILRQDFEPANPKYWILAEVQGAIVGAVSIRIRPHLWSPTPLAHLEELVIDPIRQRQGIGRVLVRKAEQFAREQGCDKVELESGLLRHGAHQFYKALGYQEVAKYFSTDLRQLMSLFGDRDQT